MWPLGMGNVDVARLAAPMMGALLLGVYACSGSAGESGSTGGSDSVSVPGEQESPGKAEQPTNPSDDTRELQAMFDDVEPGDTVTLEPREYRHSGVIHINTPDVEVNGNGATLIATNDERSAVQIKADGVNVHDLALQAPAEGERWMAPNQHKLVVEGDDVNVHSIQIDGSAGAGIFVQGAKDFSIEDVTVSHTRADGVHMTEGSANGRVEGVRTTMTGDDGVAVVSYQGDPDTVRNVDISDVTVDGTKWGRGMSVVGGEDVTISDFSISKTDSAGLYVGTEGDPYFTRAVRDVKISDGEVKESNVNSSVTQGAIVLYSGNRGQDVGDVTISDMRVEGTPLTAGRNVAVLQDEGCNMFGIEMRGFNILGGPRSSLFIQNPEASVLTDMWSRNDRVLQSPGRSK